MAIAAPSEGTALRLERIGARGVLYSHMVSTTYPKVLNKYCALFFFFFEVGASQKINITLCARALILGACISAQASSPFSKMSKYQSKGPWQDPLLSYTAILVVC